MKFAIFYEHQLPRAAGADWDDDAERRLYHEALQQVEIADCRLPARAGDPHRLAAAAAATAAYEAKAKSAAK